MKKIFLSFVFSIAIFGISNTVNAQKIAYLLSDSIIILMPETEVANKKLQEFAQKLADDSKIFEDELKKKYDEYQLNKSKWGPNMLQMKENDITDAQTRIQKFQEKAQNDIADKRQELFAPIIAKAKDAIATVAKEKGYSYVLDESQGAILYSNPADNIMNDVKKKLGIK